MAKEPKYVTERLQDIQKKLQYLDLSWFDRLTPKQRTNLVTVIADAANGSAASMAAMKNEEIKRVRQEKAQLELDKIATELAARLKNK